MVKVGVEPVSAGEVHLVLHGRLDHDGAARLRAALTTLLNQGRYHTVGLNLRGLEGVDEAGMATLAAARGVCAMAGVRLRLSGATPVAAGGRHTDTSRSIPAPVGAATPVGAE
jgi:anti-anti-sigma regulatory factor